MSKSNRNKYNSRVGFTDLLFNLVIGFVYLFVIAFILINPITKKGDVIKKADYLIVIEWDHNLNDDVDLWVQDPAGNTVAFVNKQAGLMHLEKDDLGYSSDEYRNGNEVRLVNLNREVVTLRGVIPGEYQVMAHIYNKLYTVHEGTPTRDLPGTITVQIIKINPYNEMYISKYPYSEIGQEISLVRFRLSDDGAWLGHNNQESDIITREKVNTTRGNYTGNYSPF
jgi:hypothetical protein